MYIPKTKIKKEISRTIELNTYWKNKESKRKQKEQKKDIKQKDLKRKRQKY